MTDTTISANQLQPLGVTTQEAPKSGKVIVSFLADFTGANNRTIIDTTFQQLGATFNDPVTLFMNNSTNPNPVVVVIGQTQQQFLIPANASGFFPLAAQPQSRITMSSVGGASTPSPCQLYNYAIPPVVWYGAGQPVAITGTSAVSIADGLDATLGSKADAAVTNPASIASLIALTKGLLTELISILGNQPINDIPATATTVVRSSGNVANAAATVTMPAVAGKTNYVTGFEITGLGATAAATIVATLGSLIGGNTLTYIIEVPAGVTTPISSLIVKFAKPIPCNAVNTALTLTVGAFGAGNTNAAANIEGYVN